MVSANFRCSNFTTEELYKCVSKSKREKYFNEYKANILAERKANSKVSLKERLSLLKQKEEKKKERDRKKLEEEDPKEARKRVREEAVEAYNEMLKEKILTPDISWEEALKLINTDSRYKTEHIFPERKEKLFKSHKYNLYQERKEKRQQNRKFDK